MNDPPALAADSPAAERARRLDRLCDHFEAAWKSGRPPSLERYLDNVPSAARAELFRELLVLELDYRGQRGEKPQREEYRLRFPEQSELIDTVFGESSPSASSTPSLLRRWSVNRLAHELRKSLFPAERPGTPAVQGGAQNAGSSVNGSPPPAQIFSLLARLLGAGSADPDLAGASGSSGAALNPMPPPGNGCQPEGAVAGIYGLPTQLLEPGKLPNGGASGKECPAGTVLGDYELLERLGKGGMGIVYRARQRSANRIVALKIIRPDRLEELTTQECQEWFERFRREGQIAACVEDEHLVTVYEVGQAGGQLFYSMRYVEGQSLAEILRKGPLPNQRSALYMEQVAQALHVLHLRGTVHRDVKPRNILVDTKDRPFLTDYGLAKSSAYSQGLTQFGSCMGTPEYMSPEQARDSAAAGAASDIYSLGATLYELLAGRPPFRAADPLETLRQVQDDEPLSPRRLNPAVHRDLELICLKCLQKEPHKRYATALEAAEELHRYQAGEPLVHTRPVTKAERVWRWCRRNPFKAAAAGLGMMTFTAVAAFLISLAFIMRLNQEKLRTDQARQEAERANTHLVLNRGLSLCQQGEVAHGLLLWAGRLESAPPDETLQHAFRANLAAWSRHIWAMQAILPGGNNARFAVFSPDGKTAATVKAATSQGSDEVLLWETSTWNRIGRAIRPGSVLYEVVFSPDSRTILTEGKDGFAMLWDAATGRSLGGPYCVDKWFPAAAFAPDSKTLLTATQRQPGIVIITSTDLTTGESRSVTVTHQGFPAGKTYPVAVHFSPNAKVAVTKAGCTAQVWDVVTGNPVYPALTNPANTLDVVFSPDGKLLLTVCKNGNALMWNAETGQIMFPLKGHHGDVTAAAFSPDGKIVLTGSSDKTARLWDAATGTQLRLFDGHQCPVRMVACSRDGKIIATVDGSRLGQRPHETIRGTVRLWDRASGKQLCAPLPREHVLALCLDCKAILTRSPDNTTRAWRADPDRLLASVLPNPSPVTCVAFSPDDRIILTVSNKPGSNRTGEVRLWNRATKKLLPIPFRYPVWIPTVAFSPNSNMVLIGCSDNTARLLDIRTGHVTLLSHKKCDKEEWVVAVFSPDGRIALTGSHDGTARLWNALTGELLHELTHQKDVSAVAFSHNGQMVLTGCWDGRARLWDVATGMELVEFAGETGAVKAVAFSPNDEEALIGTAGGIAQLWDAARGTKLGDPLLHSNLPVEFVAFDSGGKRVLTRSLDRVQLSDAVTGQPLVNPLFNEDFIEGAGLSPDGMTVMTASNDKTARLWDAATGERIGPALWHPDTVQSAVLSPDGRTLLTGCRDKMARLWDLSLPLAGEGKRIHLWIKVLTGLELTPSGRMEHLTAEKWDECRRQLEEQGGPPVP